MEADDADNQRVEPLVGVTARYDGLGELEYDPEPPFHAGTPKEASPEITRKVTEWLGLLDGAFRQTSETASKAWPK